jgi:hypothetical protein
LEKRRYRADVGADDTKLNQTNKKLNNKNNL